MIRSGEKKIERETFYAAKESIQTLNVNIDDIVISKLGKTKTNPKYLIGCSNKALRPLVLIMPK